MLTKNLYSSNTLKDVNGCNITVNYFITKGNDLLNDIECNYGIAVEKSPEADKSDKFIVACCFKKKSNAKILLKKLYDYSVTPVSAEETIDVLMDNCEFTY